MDATYKFLRVNYALQALDFNHKSVVYSPLPLDTDRKCIKCLLRPLNQLQT